jgi:hypothetical protein
VSGKEAALYITGVLLVIAGTAAALLLREWRMARRELASDWTDSDG